VGKCRYQLWFVLLFSFLLSLMLLLFNNSVWDHNWVTSINNFENVIQENFTRELTMNTNSSRQVNVTQEKEHVSPHVPKSNLLVWMHKISCTDGPRINPRTG
jgi:hypothetical protein